MALCSHLAFWCGGEAARMDRIFRSSGLMRDKWDSARGGSTYGAQTIERTVEGCSEFYKPKGGREHGGQRRSILVYKNASSTDAPPETEGAQNEAEFSRAPSVESWFVDKAGKLWVADAEGELRYTVTSTAPWIACDLVGVDTGDVRALVKVTTPRSVRERALDRDVLLNQNRVIGALAPLGATSPRPTQRT